MDCVSCKEPMIVLELDNVEIDYCVKCDSIWLDEGELEVLMESTEKKDEILNSFSENKTTKEKKIKCPICSKKMGKYICGTGKKVMLDKCRNNHGIWFDKGELREVINMGALDAENRVVDILKDMMRTKLEKTGG